MLYLLRNFVDRSEHYGAKQKRKASAADDKPGAPEKPKEDFGKAPSIDTDPSERFHRELINHIACAKKGRIAKSQQRISIIKGEEG